MVTTRSRAKKGEEPQAEAEVGVPPVPKSRARKVDRSGCSKRNWRSSCQFSRFVGPGTRSGYVRAYWMGNRGFYEYNGFVRPMPCEVGDYVFNNLNRTQRSKVVAVANTDFNEVTWYYPISSGNTENTRYVTYNYLLDIWTLGAIPRTEGIDRQFWEHPILAGPTGALYEHETGTTYTDEGAVSYTPYAESGPVEVGEGDVNTTLYTRIWPTATETTNGPYTNANPTDVRLTARQVRVRHTQVTGGWRVGTPRIEVVPGGAR